MVRAAFLVPASLARVRTVKVPIVTLFTSRAFFILERQLCTVVLPESRIYCPGAF